MRASSGNIPVGQKLTHLLIVVLIGNLFNKNTLFVELLKKFAGSFVVNRRSGAGVYIEIDSELFE